MQSILNICALTYIVHTRGTRTGRNKRSQPVDVLSICFTLYLDTLPISRARHQVSPSPRQSHFSRTRGSPRRNSRASIPGPGPSRHPSRSDFTPFFSLRLFHFSLLFTPASWIPKRRERQFFVPRSISTPCRSCEYRQSSLTETRVIAKPSLQVDVTSCGEFVRTGAKRSKVQVVPRSRVDFMLYLCIPWRVFMKSINTNPTFHP